jgi:glycosyltransferase involved in cell wall biosynthesis
MKTQLEALAKLGWSCRALTGSVLDNKERLEPVAALAPWGISQAGVFSSVPVWGVRLNELEHVIFPFNDTRRHYSTAVEELTFFNLVRAQIEDWKPDIVYSYGGWLLERQILRHCRMVGLPTAFLLINGNYHDASGFADVNLILAPTQLLADNYREKLGVQCEVVGEFVDYAPVLADRVAPRLVTFVNPSPEKGATMLIEIARQALDRLPDLQFLVVESRTTARMLSDKFCIDWNTLPNVTFIQQQQDMRQVYMQTKILLYPSYWYEAAGRVIFEAQANGITVLASSHGAISESLAGGGFMFDVPERCKHNYSEFPTPEEARPWVDCLERLVTDTTFLKDSESLAFSASKKHDIKTYAETLNRLLVKVVQRSTVQKEVCLKINKNIRWLGKEKKALQCPL